MTSAQLFQGHDVDQRFGKDVVFRVSSTSHRRASDADAKRTACGPERDYCVHVAPIQYRPSQDQPPTCSNAQWFLGFGAERTFICF